MRRNRAANALWIAMGTLLLASLGAVMMVRVTRGNLRTAALVRNEVEARWAAHAALAGFANRLKMRPWSERFTASTPGEYTSTLTYREHPVTLWARDSKRGSQVMTGTADVFVKAVDGEVALGVYQRLRIMPAAATNPRALRVVRELTVREDLADPAVRDAVLAKLQDDERAASEGSAAADCCARALDDAAYRDATADEAFDAAVAGRAEEPTEKRFREYMARARARAGAGELVEAVAALEEAVAQASGGSPAQSQQRRMAADYALARAQYSLALASAEPERGTRLLDSATRLDQLINDLGTKCIGPSAAYLKAQVAVMQRRPPPAAAGRTAATAAQEAQQRERTVRDIGRELEATLRRIAPEGTAFEHGTVLASELPAQFERTWNMPVAYTDTFNEIRMVKIWWFIKLPMPWPVLQRIAVTDDRGAEVRSLTVSGQYAPHLWLAEGQAMVASDLGGDAGTPLVILDRMGTVLRGFKDVTPVSTRESGGVWLAPGGETLVIFGTVEKEEGYGYWAQSLKGGPARPLMPAFKNDQMGYPEHDPIAFSPDGSHVAYMEFGENAGIRLCNARQFLDNNRNSRTCFRMTPGNEPRLPAMAWVSVAGSQQLLVFADPADTSNPEAGNLLVCDANTGNPRRIRFPSNFDPGLLLPHRTAGKVTVLDAKLKRYITYDLVGASPVAPQVQELPAGPYGERPGRGPGDVVYLARNAGGDPGIFRWDLSTGQPPERLPVPLETGPTKLRRITAPVSF